MPYNSDFLPTDTPEDFCLALKAARESKGITLAAIAEATKIPADLFACLERCDLSRWPNGLFRRSFFRDYAKTIGLPVSEACAAFVRLFPDELFPTETVAEPTKPEAEPVAVGPPSFVEALTRWWMNGSAPRKITVRIKLPK